MKIPMQTKLQSSTVTCGLCGFRASDTAPVSYGGGEAPVTAQQQFDAHVCVKVLNDRLYAMQRTQRTAAVRLAEAAKILAGESRMGDAQALICGITP